MSENLESKGQTFYSFSFVLVENPGNGTSTRRRLILPNFKLMNLQYLVMNKKIKKVKI